jgi:hypothetical protein
MSGIRALKLGREGTIPDGTWSGRPGSGAKRLIWEWSRTVAKNRAETYGGNVEHFALELREETSRYGGEYFWHIFGRIVGTEEDGSQRKGEYYWAHFYSELGQDLQDLQVSCQSDSSKGEQAEPTYAWQLAYVNQNVTIDNVERWAKVLRSVQTKLDKTQETDGYADNFGVWVLRVYKALGIKNVRLPHTSQWNADTHRVGTLAEGKEWINARIYAWHHPQVTEESRAVVVAS